jgi:enterochelin esterase family protein
VTGPLPEASGDGGAAPGHDPRRSTPYPLIVAFDGADYRDTMPLPQILDTLLATGRAPAFVALLVDDSSSATRIAELGNSARMVQLLAAQLVPWVRRGWHVTADPHRVIVTGSSAGGLAAAFVAFARPDLFGNVWSQSGAFWRGAEGSNRAPWEWLTQQVAASPRKDVRFVLDVGALEDHATLGGRGPNFRDANRRLRNALSAKGYDVTYTEVPGGNHAPQWWRGSPRRTPPGAPKCRAPGARHPEKRPDWVKPTSCGSRSPRRGRRGCG